MNTGFTADDCRKFYSAALETAARKINPHTGDKRFGPHLGTGGGFGGFFFWDTVFCALWARYEADNFPAVSSLDNLYALQDADGYICRQFSDSGAPFWRREHPVSFNPPILSWAEWELHTAGVTDTERLHRVLPKLVLHYEFCRKTYRRADGLYFGDALGCGMDNLPRLPKQTLTEAERHAGIDFIPDYCPGEPKFGEDVARSPLYSWNRQMTWIDISAQMAFNALNIAKISEAVGDSRQAEKFRAEHRELGELINRWCWDDDLGFYGDCYQERVIPRRHAGAFWTMLAEIIPPERAAKVIATLRNPEYFNRPVPFPVLAHNEPEYQSEDGYWLGSVWPPTTYAALRGLRILGAEEFAADAARRYYAANLRLWRNTGTIWENISPEQCEKPKKAASPDFCGWGNLAPIAIYHEFIAQDNHQ